MSFLDRFKKRCPSCDRRGLKVAKHFRETHANDSGVRVPAAATYARCIHCGALYKWIFQGLHHPAPGHMNGVPTPVGEEEWTARVGPDIPSARVRG